jgi:hypothetical protein
MRSFDEELVEQRCREHAERGAWLLPNAVNMRKKAQVELDNVSMNSPTDEKKKAAIVEFAVAHEMQKTWDDIADISPVPRCPGIRVPTKAQAASVALAARKLDDAERVHQFRAQAQACSRAEAERNLRL